MACRYNKELPDEKFRTSGHLTDVVMEQRYNALAKYYSAIGNTERVQHFVEKSSAMNEAKDMRVLVVMESADTTGEECLQEVQKGREAAEKACDQVDLLRFEFDQLRNEFRETRAHKRQTASKLCRQSKDAC